ncbi:small nuclear ribonucleoprotein E [Plasmodium ovale curtisi]|nr:small nuclear ribonucleoprotein E [Plasmodium ovale curtisi]
MQKAATEFAQVRPNQSLLLPTFLFTLGSKNNYTENGDHEQEAAEDYDPANLQIWLYDKPDIRIEGKILGFDEYMNMVLDESKEVSIKKKSRKELGKILLKGDTITLIMEA